MKKIITFGLTVIGLISFAGCSSETKNVKTVDVMSLSEATNMYYDTFPNSNVSSLKLKQDGSAFTYKIKGFDDDNSYELKIDGVGKTEISHDSKEKDSDNKKIEKEKLQLNDIISINKATDIAEKEINKGNAKEWSLKTDKSSKEPIWKVEVKSGMKEKDVKINAISGDVINVEK